jgi:perosamine synthetase
MVTTNNADAADRICLMRLHGIERDAWKRYRGDGSWHYDVIESGFKYNLTDFQSAMGIVQLAKCDALRNARQIIAQRYSTAFSSFDELVIPTVRSDRTTSWHLYVLRLRLSLLTGNRNCFIEALQRRGVACSVHFIPLHLHPYYQRKYGYRVGQFPQAEKEYPACLSLPIYPDMTEEEIKHVIRSVKEAIIEFRNRRVAVPASPVASV